MLTFINRTISSFETFAWDAGPSALRTALFGARSIKEYLLSDNTINFNSVAEDLYQQPFSPHNVIKCACVAKEVFCKAFAGQDESITKACEAGEMFFSYCIRPAPSYSGILSEMAPIVLLGVAVVCSMLLMGKYDSERRVSRAVDNIEPLVPALPRVVFPVSVPATSPAA